MILTELQLGGGHEFYTCKEYPTVRMLLEAVNRKGIFAGEKTTLKQLLKEMGFKFKSHDNRKYVMEQPCVIARGHDYLRKIRRYRREGRPIIYLDETWLNAHHSLAKCWIDSDGTGGLPVKSGKEGRVIILHAGWEHGWIPGASLVFRGKTGTGDYHNEMNIDHFMEWFSTQLIPNIPASSVIVLDNAKYHNAVVEKQPTTSTRKADIQAWLQKHNISFDDSMLKSELLLLVRFNSVPTVYKTDIFAEAAGHCVLRLPIAHCELNPIELVWAQVKGYAARNNKNFTMAEALNLSRDGIDMVTAEKWAACVKHVIDKVEPDFWEKDRICENIVEEFTICVGGDSSSEDDDD